MKTFFRDTLVICFGLFCCLFVSTCNVWIARLRIGDCLRQTGLFALVECWWLMPPKMRIWSVLEMCSWGVLEQVSLLILNQQSAWEATQTQGSPGVLGLPATSCALIAPSVAFELSQTNLRNGVGGGSLHQNSRIFLFTSSPACVSQERLLSG